MKRIKIIVIVGMLVFVSTVGSVSGFKAVEKKPQQLSRGQTFYVGGSGPGNYSKIQDAVDAASDGDTVYVYDDSSPYHENIVINVSISLVGEDKNTTIIDGSNNGHSLNITADNVMVTGFTIQNGNDSGIIINSNNNRITDNILSDNIYGIKTSWGEPFKSFQNNTITNNDIIRDGAGITFFNGRNTTITDNLISHTEQGIVLMGTMNNNISFNTISKNGIGIWITSAYNTLIYRNNISQNGNIGVWTFITSADKILQNNFIGNNKSAISVQPILSKIRMLKIKFNIPIRRNVWNQNYWDKPRLLPYVIPGVFLKLTFMVDWRPAQKLYDIPGINR
jgi:parallel beta-helix repeat protein